MQPNCTHRQQQELERCSEGELADDNNLLPNLASCFIAAGLHATHQAGQLAPQAECAAPSPGHGCQEGAFACIGQANNAHISHHLHSSKNRPEHLST